MSTTETKVRHSATPWTTGENGDGCAKGHAIVADGIVIAKVYGRGYPVGAGYHPQSAADAEFIVRAVNSHADMLETLEQALHCLASCQQAIDTPNDRNTAGLVRMSIQDHRAHIQAAIAKAKGGAA